MKLNYVFGILSLIVLFSCGKDNNNIFNETVFQTDSKPITSSSIDLNTYNPCVSSRFLPYINQENIDLYVDNHLDIAEYFNSSSVTYPPDEPWLNIANDIYQNVFDINDPSHFTVEDFTIDINDSNIVDVKYSIIINGLLNVVDSSENYDDYLIGLNNYLINIDLTSFNQAEKENISTYLFTIEMEAFNTYCLAAPRYLHHVGFKHLRLNHIKCVIAIGAGAFFGSEAGPFGTIVGAVAGWATGPC